MEFADYTDLDFRDLTAVTTFRDYAVANNLVLDEGFYKRAIAVILPLKWSSAMFRKTEETHGQQTTEARRDCHEVTAG